MMPDTLERLWTYYTKNCIVSRKHGRFGISVILREVGDKSVEGCELWFRVYDGSSLRHLDE
jgi:hypothetical protein